MKIIPRNQLGYFISRWLNPNMKFLEFLSVHLHMCFVCFSFKGNLLNEFKLGFHYSQANYSIQKWDIFYYDYLTRTGATAGPHIHIYIHIYLLTGTCGFTNVIFISEYSCRFCTLTYKDIRKVHKNQL